MDRIDYDIWALRVNEAIRARTRPQVAQVPIKEERATPKKLLLEFAAEATDIVGAIGRNIENVLIQGNERSAALNGFLDEMLKFNEFSFLEYRYKLPSKHQPGLRFKVETDGDAKRIVVQYFQDLVFWPVDEAGRRIFHKPVQFDLRDGRIKAIPNPEMSKVYSGCGSWKAILRETLALPFRFLYDPVDIH